MDTFLCVWSYMFLAVLHEMGSTSASKAVPALFSSISTAVLWKHSCLQLWDAKKTCKGCIEGRCIVNFLGERSGNDLPANISYCLIFFQSLRKQGKKKKIAQEKVCIFNLNYGNWSQVASGTQLKGVTLLKTSEMKHQLAAVSQTKTG